MIPQSRTGDTVTNVALFLTITLIGIIILTWYLLQAAPYRAVTDTVLDDAQELQQHVRNACGVTRYNGTFVPTTPATEYLMNATHLCVIHAAFGTCTATPCALEPSSFVHASGMIAIERVDNRTWISQRT